MHYNTLCIIHVYAQRDRPDEKAEQAAKEQLEKEKPGEKKGAEEPPRKKRRVQKFPSLTAQMKEDIQKGKWLTDSHIHLAQSLLSPISPYQWPAVYFAFRERCF